MESLTKTDLKSTLSSLSIVTCAKQEDSQPSYRRTGYRTKTSSKESQVSEMTMKALEFMCLDTLKDKTSGM